MAGYDFLRAYFCNSKPILGMPFFIIVIGASAGGRDTLCKLAATLPRRLDAAVFMVMHLPR